MNNEQQITRNSRSHAPRGNAYVSRDSSVSEGFHAEHGNQSAIKIVATRSR